MISRVLLNKYRQSVNINLGNISDLDELDLNKKEILRIFDFDDVIIKTNRFVLVKKNGKVIKKLSSSKFAEHVKKSGEEFDFSDFNKEIRNPVIIKSNIELIKRNLQFNKRRTVILTARQNPRPVITFLKSIGIFIPVIALDNSDPHAKVNWIESQIENGFIDIFFMDDSSKNIKAVDRLKIKYPNIKIKTKLFTMENQISMAELEQLIENIVLKELMARKNMPQIKTANLRKVKRLAGSMMTKKFVKVANLKKTQKELISSKVIYAVNRMKSEKLTDPKKLSSPIVISKDNWIIDGHHRWAAIFQQFGEKAEIPAFVINLPKQKSLDFWYKMEDKITK